VEKQSRRSATERVMQRVTIPEVEVEWSCVIAVTAVDSSRAQGGRLGRTLFPRATGAGDECAQAERRRSPDTVCFSSRTVKTVLSTGAIAVDGTVELAQGLSGPALGSVRGVGFSNGPGVAAQARAMRSQKARREAMRQSCWACRRAEKGGTVGLRS
jgi:hypothetical protein